MGEKIAKLGIKRDPDLMYYIKAGDVWAVPRKKPNVPKGTARLVAKAGVEIDYSKFIYFLDADGDVARKERRGIDTSLPVSEKKKKAAKAKPKAKKS